MAGGVNHGRQHHRLHRLPTSTQRLDGRPAPSARSEFRACRARCSASLDGPGGVRQRFLLPFAPDAPKFFLIPGNNQVTVLWQPTAVRRPAATRTTRIGLRRRTERAVRPELPAVRRRGLPDLPRPGGQPGPAHADRPVRLRRHRSSTTTRPGQSDRRPARRNSTSTPTARWRLLAGRAWACRARVSNVAPYRQPVRPDEVRRPGASWPPAWSVHHRDRDTASTGNASGAAAADQHRRPVHLRRQRRPRTTSGTSMSVTAFDVNSLVLGPVQPRVAQADHQVGDPAGPGLQLRADRARSPPACSGATWRSTPPGTVVPIDPTTGKLQRAHSRRPTAWTRLRRTSSSQVFERLGQLAVRAGQHPHGQWTLTAATAAARPASRPSTTVTLINGMRLNDFQLSMLLAQDPACDASTGVCTSCRPSDRRQPRRHVRRRSAQLRSAQGPGPP